MVTHKAQKIGDAASDLTDELHSGFNEAGAKVRQVFNSASHEISHVAAVLNKEVRTNPIQSSLIALGIGLLLGRLCRR